MTKLLFGCGYLGRRVAARWLAAGHAVAAVTRSPERARQLAQDGLQPIVADVTRPETLAALPPAETVVYAVGYDPPSGHSRWQIYVEGLRAVFDALAPSVRRVVFISSTGVFGQTDGGWVDEASRCCPTREAGQAFCAAERVLTEHPLGGRAIVLRLAGLYGPGRIQRRADLLAGRPLPVVADSYLNLIHVDDAASAILAADVSPDAPRLFLVADGHPVDRRAYFTWLAERLGAPAPTFVDPPPEMLAVHHSGSNKRVSNARMLAELGVELRYPSYREGVAASLAPDC